MNNIRYIVVEVRDPRPGEQCLLKFTGTMNECVEWIGKQPNNDGFYQIDIEVKDDKNF